MSLSLPPHHAKNRHKKLGGTYWHRCSSALLAALCVPCHQQQPACQWPAFPWPLLAVQSVEFRVKSRGGLHWQAGRLADWQDRTGTQGGQTSRWLAASAARPLAAPCIAADMAHRTAHRRRRELNGEGDRPRLGRFAVGRQVRAYNLRSSGPCCCYSSCSSYCTYHVVCVVSLCAATMRTQPHRMYRA
jgi:hypothetical protein